ncbi:hypothetical protein fHeYen902_084c [Yersinia phage fHe-Yen9-02]|nr:hypothetical protein fHeYen902_084c [Yersinia phage fHe-Yen9-02]
MQFISTANHLAVSATMPEIFLFDRADGIDIDQIVDRTTLKTAVLRARGIAGIGVVNCVSGRMDGKYYLTNFKYRGGTTLASIIDNPVMGQTELSNGSNGQDVSPYLPSSTKVFSFLVPLSLCSSATLDIVMPEFGQKGAYRAGDSQATIYSYTTSEVSLSVYSGTHPARDAYAYARPTVNTPVSNVGTVLRGMSDLYHTAAGSGGWFSQRAAPINTYTVQAGVDEQPIFTDAVTSPSANLLIKFSDHEILVNGSYQQPTVPGTKPTLALNTTSYTSL